MSSQSDTITDRTRHAWIAQWIAPYISEYSPLGPSDAINEGALFTTYTVMFGLDPDEPATPDDYDSSVSRPTDRSVTLMRCGWPCRSMEGSLWIDGEAGSQIPEALFRPSKRHSWMPDLPLRPLWGATAINSAMYAILLWLPVHGMLLLRRWNRRRRGLCPQCAYDLHAAPKAGCPECGHNRPA